MYSKIIVLSCLLLTGMVTTTFGQKGNKNIKVITSLKLNPTAARFLMNVDLDCFTINRTGVLRATEGHRIIFYQNEKKLYITDLKHVETIEPWVNHNDTKDLGNGVTMHCNGCPSCKVKEGTPGGNGKKTYMCRGACSCVDFVEVETSVASWETPGGGYSNDWRGR